MPEKSKIKRWMIATAILLIVIISAILALMMQPKKSLQVGNVTHSLSEAENNKGEEKTYAIGKYGMVKIVFSLKANKWLTNVTEESYESYNPYNPQKALIFCAQAGAGEQCGDGFIVHVYDKSSCNTPALDAVSRDWCNRHKNINAVSKWIKYSESEPNSIETLWHGNEQYLYEFIPEGDEANTFLKSTIITITI